MLTISIMVSALITLQWNLFDVYYFHYGFRISMLRKTIGNHSHYITVESICLMPTKSVL